MDHNVPSAYTDQLNISFTFKKKEDKKRRNEDNKIFDLKFSNCKLYDSHETLINV